jgi:hypothetical protein
MNPPIKAAKAGKRSGAWRFVRSEYTTANGVMIQNSMDIGKLNEREPSWPSIIVQAGIANKSNVMAIQPRDGSLRVKTVRERPTATAAMLENANVVHLSMEVMSGIVVEPHRLHPVPGASSEAPLAPVEPAERGGHGQSKDVDVDGVLQELKTPGRGTGMSLHTVARFCSPAPASRRGAMLRAPSASVLLTSRPAALPAAAR